ncbi:hypothetical protein PIB30_057661 [Stylosanthes scabra]|uniref:Uncharacterized protein n=1 Tax=Stylosanthes scabra TaxID=79078 RepID=A0ABU6ZIF0_9FABA|nr:hypothetical protein [Stylosanthes scabra]
MDSSPNDVDLNSDACHEIVGTATGVDEVNILEFLDSSLYVGIDDVDVGEADAIGEEFEMKWMAMLDDCDVREVEWVKDLYAKKELWSTAYKKTMVTDKTRMQIALDPVMGKHNPKVDEVCKLAISTWDRKVLIAKAKMNPWKNKRMAMEKKAKN